MKRNHPTTCSPLGRPVHGNLRVELRPLGELTPNPKNPRVHPKRQVRQIAESIRTFGFTMPILVDADNRVLAGHGRLKACELLGWTEVPTIRLDHLSEAQAKAYLVADNRLSERSTWDPRLLGETLQDLSLQDLDFSLEVTGFEVAEIDLLIEGLEAAPPGDDPDDQVPPPLSFQVSRLGDLWLLGPHRLLCGNALEAEAYKTLMTGDKAAMVFTDSPYNVPIDGHVGGNGAIHHRDFIMASGEMSAAEFETFLTTACRHLAQNSADGSLHYLCMDWRGLQALLAAGGATYTELKNLCVWVKDVAGMGSLYRSQHELVAVFKNGHGPHRNNVQLGRFGRNRSNVWHYAGLNSFRGRTTEEGDLLALHPTVKPVALVAGALKDASARGDLVLDPFLGSGTTLIVAERTGRVCRAMELDPVYVDTALRRWQTLTCQTPTLAATGQTFEAVQAERLGATPGEARHG